MPRPLTLAFALAIAATLSTLCPAPAASAAVSGYSYTGGFATAPSNHTIGFGFYIPQAITITQLGAVDVNGTGLTAATPVGLWNDAGTLLSSTSVPAGAGAAAIDGFRYTPITPVELAGDAVYWVGMLASTELVVSQVTPAAAPGIIILNGGELTYSVPGTSLTFPKVNVQGGMNVAGNFQFVVPEPASLALLGVASLATLARRRR